MQRVPHIVCFVTLAIVGCAREPARQPLPDLGVVSDAGNDATTPSDASETGAACTPMFGRPSERTGLSGDLCGPNCGCGTVDARLIPDTDVEGWLAWAEASPAAELLEDPYADPAPQVNEGEMCVLSFDATAGSYTMETRVDVPANGVLTHGGACGLCSTLQDLAAYIRNPDLTEPVRECGLLGIREGQDANIACLEDLGFTRPCAEIWYYNTKNTRTACLAPCFEALNAPYHLEDGSLNACLECDETTSGPVFKAVAGRTRRNSGLASAICRPCESVTAVSHEYPAVLQR